MLDELVLWLKFNLFLRNIKLNITINSFDEHNCYKAGESTSAGTHLNQPADAIEWQVL